MEYVSICTQNIRKIFMYSLCIYREIWKSTNKINAKLLLSREKFCRINCCLEKVMVWGIKKSQNSYLKKIYGWVKKIKSNFWLEKLILWSTNYKVTKFFSVQDFGVSLKQFFLGFRFLVFLYENFCSRTLVL